MRVGVDDGILILAVHGSPLFVSISPTLVDRSWSCQSAQALQFASVLCAGNAAISQADTDSLLPLRSSWRRPTSRIGFLTFFYGRSHIAGPESCHSRFCLMKNPLLYRSARPESGRELRERFPMAPQLVQCSTAIVSGTSTRSRNSFRCHVVSLISNDMGAILVQS